MQQEETKFCPFRKTTYFMASSLDQVFNASIQNAEFIEENFLPCLKEKCMLWNNYFKTCDLKNRI